MNRQSYIMSGLYHLVLSSLLLAGLNLSGCSKQPETDSDVSTDRNSVKNAPENDGSIEIPLSELAGKERRQIDIEYEPTNVPYELDKHPVYVGGLGYRPSLTWKYQGQTGDTAAWFTYGPLGDDTRQASLTVHFVPEDEAPEYTEYFAYWLSLMDYSNLENPESAALRHDRQADGMTVHVQSLYGPYEPPPGQLGPDESSPLPRHRLVGIVVEAPEGLVLFELVGPDHTARVMIEQFMNMIFRLKKAPSQS
jgi:hypothetical protein